MTPTNSGKITLAVLGTKLDAQTEAIKGLMAAFEKHVGENRVVELDVDRLKETKRAWSRHFWIIYTSLIGGISAWIATLTR